MKGVIWSYTFDYGKEKLQSIENAYNLIHIPTIKRIESQSTCQLVFENGDVWRVVRAHENMRGCRANISYIDHRIDPIFINTIIKPCTTALPFNGTQYF